MEPAKLSRTALIAMVVGSMVGAGIFSLPSVFARSTGPQGSLVAWAIAGVGMLTLAMVFQFLARRRPELDSGIFIYAKKGFGPYVGFLAAMGYWTAACLGNVSYFVVFKATLGALFPIFGDGDTLPAVLVSSVLLWATHFGILRGIKQAAGMNTVVTIAKIVPILIFIACVALAIDTDVLMENIREGAGPGQGSLVEQVRGTMLVTVFVFLGVEGASVYSRYAKNRDDVAFATVTGFLLVLALLVSVTLLSYGILPRAELAGLRNPSMAGVLQAAVGPWGAVLVSVGLMVSVAGAYLSWILLAAEVLHAAARFGTMPEFLSRQNRHGVPHKALWLSNGVVQVFLLGTLFTQDTFVLIKSLASSMSLVPYFFVAGFGLLLASRGETYQGWSPRRCFELCVAAVATIYAIVMIVAGGFDFFVLSSLIYAPGTILFVIARKEQRSHVFDGFEWAIFGAIVLAAAAGLWGLVSSGMTLTTTAVGH
ncbi:basic amino acid/polyamine antiporter [Pusillimonas noertemannii]|uniref:Arginine:ornithine antiporter (APA family) n=1 Tax=Pusillimonas noertemannii TaxID=305977 RepID=A0A2U1CK46_9BURK|nr:basic amino acid/polyamine antiporter [Pusillimonas noertemannii]NYT69705.1 amino acid permease [Pusillimonas noertemannii]PVY61371.1 arginine:ornithine antiporter (APA family) [Pusillimonas noertemannii]TFL09267.1 amino acid permease [Pusillimonas noertemannii]